MNKICVFGANGQTGIELTKQAIANNVQMKAAVRRASSMNEYKSNIEVVEYSFDTPKTVKEAMKDCDVVISVIGSGSGKAAASPTTLYSNSIKLIIEQMREMNINRLIVISSAGVDYDEKAPWYYRYLFRPWLMNSYMDMMKMETILEENMDIQWTIVRPTYLLDGKSKEYLAINRKVGKGNFKINRGDVAAFILKELQNDKWIHQYPVLGYKQ